MAGRGTGLPSQRGDVATTLVDTRAYGAGEAAAAEGFARAGQALDRLVQTLEPALQQEAARKAEQDAAAGRFEERMVINGADAAYNRALTEGTLARLANARDADLDKLALDNAFDPDGFQTAVQAYRRSALETSVPSSLAITWASDFDARSNQQLGRLRAARAERDLGEAKTGIAAFRDRMVREAVDLSAGRPMDVALGDEQLQGRLLQAIRAIDELTGNPAFGVSEEEGRAMRAEALATVKAGAASAYVLDVLKREGTEAAFAAVEALGAQGFEDQTERALVIGKARDALTGEIQAANQRRAQAAQERNWADQELDRQVSEALGRVELTGEAVAPELVERVRAVRGAAGVADLYRKTAEAREFNALVGDLPLNDPNVAAEQIRQRTSQRGLASLPLVGDDADLATLTQAIIQVESGGRNGLVSADPDGAGPAGGGAMGVMQLLPATAERMAAKVGVPFDPARLRTDRDYNTRLGQAYLSELLQRYGGDTFLAVTAYHAGEGNVDGWISRHGDPRSGQISREAWLDRVERAGNPRSAAYPRKVLAALGAGQANAAWAAYRENRANTLSDPAAAVQTDYAVRLAREAWQKTPGDTTAAETFVRANLAAQDRAGVPQGKRRTLPLTSLVEYAGVLRRFEEAQDAANYRAFSEHIIDRFGEAGDRVLQDVLMVEGATAFSAQVAAAATRSARTAAPPPPPAQVAAARRVQTITNAGAGAESLRGASNDEVLRRAGLQ